MPLKEETGCKLHLACDAYVYRAKCCLQSGEKSLCIAHREDVAIDSLLSQRPTTAMRVV